VHEVVGIERTLVMDSAGAFLSFATLAIENRWLTETVVSLPLRPPIVGT